MLRVVHLVCYVYINFKTLKKKKRQFVRTYVSNSPGQKPPDFDMQCCHR